MTRNPSKPPDRAPVRRKPRQDRAIFTVASILDATELLARRSGFVKLETARIAATAGVSIGTLYQYFANLEAILLRLYEERSAAVAHAMKAAMVKALNQPPEQALPEVMWLILRLHEKHHLILHRMVEEVPQLRLQHHPASLGNLVNGSISAYLRHQSLGLKPGDLNRKAFFIESVGLGCVRNYLNDSRRITKRAFIADLTRITVHYVTT